MTDAAPAPLSLLKTGQYDHLHTYLTALENQFESGQIGEQELLRAFQGFYSFDLTLGEGFQAWTMAHPDTYPLTVARAAWCLGRGWAARGQMTSNLVSDQGWRALHHFL